MVSRISIRSRTQVENADCGGRGGPRRSAAGLPYDLPRNAIGGHAIVAVEIDVTQRHEHRWRVGPVAAQFASEAGDEPREQGEPVMPSGIEIS